MIVPSTMGKVAIKEMNRRIFTGLLLCNLVWSMNPVMGKLLLRDFSSVEAAWIRNSSALISYGAVLLILRMIPGFRLAGWDLRRGKFYDAVLLGLLGFLTFCLSPLLQMSGLSASLASDSALITALEPLVTVFLAWVFLGQRLTGTHWLSFGVALIGFILLTDLTSVRVSHGTDEHLLGNFLILVSLGGEASYSIISKKLLDHFRPVVIFGISLAFGVLFLSLVMSLYSGFPILEHFTWRSLLAALWIGPLGTTVTYLYWMSVLVSVPVASMVLTLFIQPVIGAFFAGVVLEERLSLYQFLGGILIMLAVMGPLFDRTSRTATENWTFEAMRYLRKTWKRVLINRNRHN